MNPDFDRRLRASQRDLEMKERQGLAVQAALAEHSVTSYVRNLPVEDASYPAIEYLRLHPQDGIGDEGQEGTRDCHSEHLMQEGPRPHRQCKIRIYRECHRILRTFDGYHDCTGSYIRYIRDDPVVVFAEDFDLVRNIFQSFKSRLRDESLTIVDFSRMCPLTLCTLDLGLPLDDDLVMANPFEEPDEYFLRRQKAAFGTETEVVM